MYIPPSFQESDPDKLFDFVEQHSFGLLVSQVHGEAFATHLPLLLDRQRGPRGTLLGHMARANSQWTAENPAVLAIFSGPHAYISPSWYQSENVVPTWNYVAVHVYGTLQLIESEQAVHRVLRDYVAYYERSLPEPWQAADSDPYIAKLARAVTAFEVPIDRLEGKWKLGQNHSGERRQKVIDVLSRRGDENSQAIAALMTRTLSESP